MKTITNFDNALEYINRLGFSGGKGPGWIPEAQRRLCLIESALYKAANNAYPYRVVFHTHKDRYTRYTYPWLGWFEIHAGESVKYVLCSRLDDSRLSQWAIVNRRPVQWDEYGYTFKA